MLSGSGKHAGQKSRLTEANAAAPAAIACALPAPPVGRVARLPAVFILLSLRQHAVQDGWEALGSQRVPAGLVRCEDECIAQQPRPIQKVAEVAQHFKDHSRGWPRTVARQPAGMARGVRQVREAGGHGTPALQSRLRCHISDGPPRLVVVKMTALFGAAVRSSSEPSVSFVATNSGGTGGCSSSPSSRERVAAAASGAARHASSSKVARSGAILRPCWSQGGLGWGWRAASLRQGGRSTALAERAAQIGRREREHRTGHADRACREVQEPGGRAHAQPCGRRRLRQHRHCPSCVSRQCRAASAQLTGLYRCHCWAEACR